MSTREWKDRGISEIEKWKLFNLKNKERREF